MERRGGELLDLLIVGAGLSGIGAACHQAMSDKRYAIVEARETIDAHLGPVSLPRRALRLRHVYAGHDFKSWKDAKAIADGPAIPALHPRDSR